MSEYCVCCGREIPEGLQVCPVCEEWANKKQRQEKEMECTVAREILDGEYKLELCPVCQSPAAWRLSPAGTRRHRRMEYGVCCSNNNCSWSYAFTAYQSKEDAAAQWNKKCREKRLLDADSARLKSCSCGGKARLIFERYGGTAQGWFVRCESCGRLLTAAECKDAIIESWNRRMEDGA